MKCSISGAGLKGRFPLTFAFPARAERSLLWTPSRPRPREQIFKARAGKATATENDLKTDTHRTRFGNAARFFIFQKQINRSTIENFGRYEKYTTPAVEMLQTFQ